MTAVGDEAVTVAQFKRMAEIQINDGDDAKALNMRRLRAYFDGVSSSYPDIPDDYTALEYIQASGSQYIDTGFTPDNNSRIVYSAERVSNNSSDHFFGVRTGVGNSNGFNVYIYNSGWRSGYANTVATTNTAGVGRFLIDKNRNVTHINDIVLESESAEFDCTGTAYLFALNSVGNNPAYSTHRCYWCKIYDNDILVRDYVPVINNNGVAGMFDMVNDQFYTNVASGSFISGPERPKPNDLDDSVISLKQFSKVWNVKNAEYLILDSITSTGTQKIILDVVPNQNSRIVVDADMGPVTTNSTGSYFFGSIWNNSGIGYETYLYGDLYGNYQFYTKYGNTYASQPTTITQGTRITIDLNKNVHAIISADGTPYFSNTYSAQQFTSMNKLCLFSLERGLSASQMFVGAYTLHAFKYYQDDILKLDMVPCRRRSDGAIGLWDKINKTFYPNDGSGAFIPGSVIGVVPNRKKYKVMDKLGFNGETYINLGIIPSKNVRIHTVYEVDNSIKTITYPIAAFGCRDSKSSNRIENFVYSNYIRIGYDSTTKQAFTPYSGSINGQIIDMDLHSATTVKMNGSTTSSFTFSEKSENSTCDLYLGQINTSGTLYDRGFVGWVYSFKTYDSDKSLDLVPCMEEDGGEYGMLDKNSNKFYGATEGTFMPGTFTGETIISY